MKLLKCTKCGREFLCRENKKCDAFRHNTCSCTQCFDNGRKGCEELQSKEKVLFT